MSSASRETDAWLPLAPGELHVWTLRLEAAPDALPAWAALLSESELQRAERFHFAEHRRRYVVAHGQLRAILGRYLATDPTQLRFDYGPQGKPSLAGLHRGLVEFNLAHSHELALLAVGHVRLGVDLERVRTVREQMAIARSHFTPAEAERLLAADAEEDATFFRIWTRKEAIIKAVGVGLSLPLHRFDVSSAAPASDPWQCVRVPDHSPPDWQLRDLPTEPGYRAAVAIEGRTPVLRRLEA